MKFTISITPHHILKTVCAFYNLTEKELISKNRRQKIVEARQMYCYICRKLTKFSLEKIGQPLHRDHATVLYSANKVENEIEIYSSTKSESIKLRLEINKIQKQIDEKYNKCVIVDDFNLLSISKMNTLQLQST